ncbi:hypothetical protein HY629_02940 [Candidatus Uhrbacteria bacterium]|nr:hypothetical protein [Candidatus Uhrbacteria bacterium]
MGIVAGVCLMLSGCETQKPLGSRLISVAVDGQQIQAGVLRQKLELLLAPITDDAIYVDTHTVQYERTRVGSDAPPIKELVVTTTIVTRLRSIDDISAIVYWRKGVSEKRQVLERERAITESWSDAIARLKTLGVLSGVDPKITTVTVDSTDVTDPLLRHRLTVAFDGITDENIAVTTELIPYQSLTLGVPDPDVDGVQAHTRVITTARFVEDEAIRRLWSKGASREEQQYERDRAVIESWLRVGRELRSKPAPPVQNVQPQPPATQPVINPALLEATGAGQ